MLRLETLTRRFGSTTVLKGIDLEVPEGDVICIVGQSGCGKSTLLRLVAGLDRPDAGSIHLAGREISSPGWALEPSRRRLNMVFQDYALWPHMTVERIVGYGLNRLPRAERDRRVHSLLEQMRIAPLARRLPAQISGGQQQRVAIARALATDPDLLLFDEPLSNLDVQLRLEMRLEFAELFRRVGKTVLYVTHDPLEACSFADRLVVMQAGRIEQSGPPAELFARPRSAWIATLAGFDTRLSVDLLDSDARGLTHIGIGHQRLRLARSEPCPRLAPGRPAQLMLRSDSIRLLSDGESGDNMLVGRITGCLFEGREWRGSVDIAGQNLAVMMPAPLPAGTEVRLAIPVEGQLLFGQKAEQATTQKTTRSEDVAA